MKNVLLVVVCCLFFSACAPTLYWRQAGKTQQEFYQDNSQCLAMSSGGGNRQIAYAGNNSVMQGYNMGAAMASRDQQTAIYNQCLMGHGWYLSKE